MNPPSAIQGAMGRERKPFTYTPGGLDLSEIKSERMAKRLMRNAMNQGVPELPPQQQSPSTPTTPIVVPNFNCMPVQVFPTFNLPANPKSLLRTRSTPADQPPREPLQPRVNQSSQASNNNKPSGIEHLRETLNNNASINPQVNNNNLNNNRPVSMIEINSKEIASMYENIVPTVPNNVQTLPRTNYGSDAYTTPIMPQISYDAEFLNAIPKQDQSHSFSMPLSYESNDTTERTESTVSDHTIKPISDVNVLIETKPVEETKATDDYNEQREVKVVKKQVKKEKKVETQNGGQNGDAEAEMVVKLPTKKAAPKVETKVEVVKKVLPDGSVEEVKTTTTKTTVDGRTEIKTKTETTIIPKEEEEEEVEEVEEEEENGEAIIEEAEESRQEEVVEEPTTVVVKKTVKQEPTETSKVVKREERSETTTTKKVVVVQQSPKEEELEEEEEEEEEEVEEPEPVVVKKVVEKAQSVQKEKSEQEEIENKVVEKVEEKKEVVEKVETKKEVEEEEEEEEEEEVEKVEVVKEEVKAEPLKKDEPPKQDEPAKEEEEGEVEEEEEFEEAEEVNEKQELKSEKPIEPTKQEEPVKTVESKEQNEEADEESEYTEEEIESEKEEASKQAPTSETQPQPPKPEPEKEEPKQEDKKEEPKEEAKEEPAVTLTGTSQPDLKVPLREPSIPLEKVEDIEIKPIGATHETVSRTTTSSTEIIKGGNDKPAGTLSTQTEYNRYENIVTVNRTTKTLDQSYEQLTQQGIPTVKTYFAPERERVSTSPQPCRPYQPSQIYYPPQPQQQQQQERRHSLLLERLSTERQMPSDLYQNQNYQYNTNQNLEQQRLWSQEPQSEVVNVSNVKPSKITNQQWYQQSRKENVIYNNITPSTPAVPSQQWSQPLPQVQPQQQPIYQQQHQPQPQPQNQFQTSYNESLQNNSRVSSNTYQQTSYPNYAPTPTNWASNNLSSLSTVNTQSNQYSLLNKDSTESYQKTSQQYSSTYVPPPWEQDPGYVAPPLQTQNFYQPPPSSNTFNSASIPGWKPTPPPGKFSKPISTSYVPPAPNQSFVKTAVEPPKTPGRKTYYSEYERRYISVPESTYIPSETKLQPQPDPSPQYYYDNNEPAETVEHTWRKELREFTEKTTQQQTQQQTDMTSVSSVKPPWEEDPKYAKVPTVAYNPTPSWSQTLRPQSYRERSFESEFVGSNEWSKTNTLGRGRPLSSYGNSNLETSIPERPRGVSVDRYNPNNYQSPIPSEHGPVQAHTLTPTPPVKGHHNPNVPAYHARASAEPREQQPTIPRNWGESRHSPIQSRSFKYLQWITGTEN